eukprot:2853955-Alexandrium_andersonii.AAC.1
MGMAFTGTSRAFAREAALKMHGLAFHTLGGGDFNIGSSPLEPLAAWLSCSASAAAWRVCSERRRRFSLSRRSCSLRCLSSPALRR